MKKKKGFTLVELLVVIAILAVLATVSVVGYMGFTKKAQESNDIGLTTQMNTILQAEEVNNKPATPHEAVKQLEEGGVLLEKLTPTTSGYNYVYDLDANRMFLLNENKDVVAPTNVTYTKDLNVFAFVGSESEVTNWTGYSLYLKDGFDAATLEVSTGLDVGDNATNVIDYKNTGDGQTVVIRTNGGTLNVNAEKDKVYHYGKTGNVNVIKCASHSYYESGEVNKLTINYGHVELKNGAVVNTLLVENENKDNVTLSTENNVEITNAILPAGIEGESEITAKAENKVDSSNDDYIVNDVSKLNELINVTTGNVYVKLGSDINVGNTSISVAPNGGNAKITIDGDNHTITSINSRAIQTCEKSGPSFNGELTILNLNFKSNCTVPTGNPSSIRGLSLWKFNATLNVFNSKIEMPTGHDNYGINLAITNGKTTLNIQNTEITAYQCVNIYGTNNNVNIENCKLTTRNEHNSFYHGGCVTVFEESSASVCIENTYFLIIESNYAKGLAFATGSVLGDSIFSSIIISRCFVNENKFSFDDIEKRKDEVSIFATIDGVSYSK